MFTTVLPTVAILSASTQDYFQLVSTLEIPQIYQLIHLPG